MNDFQLKSDDLSFEDQIAHVTKTVKENWFSSYPYTTDNAVQFTTKEPSSLLTNSLFRIHSLYMSMLFRSLSKKGSIIKDEEVLNEVSHWNREGGLCIYLSVLMYSLMLQEKVANRHDLRYIQGFTTYKSTNPFLNLLSGGGGTSILNFHAWLSYKNAVLDFSIGQEEGFIGLGDKEYIWGEIPEGITMIGFKESDKTVQKYVEMFAKHRNMSKKDWILWHTLQSITCAKESLDYLSDK